MNFDWKNCDVLITGGTGTFGNEAVRVLLGLGVRRVAVYSRDELKQAVMATKFNHDPRLRFFVGDVRDRDRLARAFQNIDVVFHAAALKHVPACEYNPNEAVMTNVLGTRNVIDAAIDARVSRVVGISTDKACQPVNLYGATKLCAEKLLINGNVYSGAPMRPRFAVVRYGNVFGSRGSVVDIFLAQRHTGTLTVTHPDMTRFWFTIDSAVAFTLLATEICRGGEIFVPRLPSVRITAIAEAVAPTAKIEIVGRRPGEKLHEILISSEEVPRARSLLGRGYIIEPENPSWRYVPWGVYPPILRDTPTGSDTNTVWKTSAEIREWLHSIGVL